MAKNRHELEDIIYKLLEANVLLAQGKTVFERPPIDAIGGPFFQQIN